MKVWLYYRLSRDEDDELNSLTNQRKIIYEYAVTNGHEVVVESFDDNVSGKHSDIMLPQIVDEQRCLRPMTAKARQILDYDCFDAPGFNRLVDFIDALAVEVHSADIVIEGLAHNLVTVCDRIFINDFSLICQGVQLIILVPAQAII